MSEKDACKGTQDDGVMSDISQVRKSLFYHRKVRGILKRWQPCEF